VTYFLSKLILSTVTLRKLPVLPEFRRKRAFFIFSLKLGGVWITQPDSLWDPRVWESL